MVLPVGWDEILERSDCDSYTELAEELEVDKSYLSKMKSGERNPTVPLLINLSDIVDMTPGELLDTLLNDDGGSTDDVDRQDERDDP